MERRGRAVHEELAAAGAPRSREDVEQLVLPLALERHDSEHLARVELERHVLQLRPGSEGTDREAGVRRGRPMAGRPPGDRRHLAGDLSEHEPDDPFLGPRRHVDDADGLTLAEHRRPVADGRDLDEAVRDEDDRPIAAPVAADDLQDALGEVRGQGRSHLVEHQHVGLDRQRAGEVDDPERGQRQSPRHARQVEVLDAELREPVAERLQRRGGEAQVGPDVEVRDERRLLVDGDQPAPACLGRGVDRPLTPANGDPAGVGMDRARQDLDEGALAGAVRAHERMDLAGAHRERGRLQRNDGAVGLRDAGGLEQEAGRDGGHRHHSCWSDRGRDAQGTPASRHPLC